MADNIKESRFKGRQGVFKNANVLVIDDDLETLKLLELTLERSGMRPFLAANWDQAKGHIKNLVAKGASVDVIVLDIMMPERSGFDILRSLQVHLIPLPPVIMLTVLRGIEDQIEARSLGATRYLTKPTTPEKFVETVKEVLREAAGD
jgi:DNA-binding response OmpR family regulator